ncbi:MAG: 2-amino-4-hydroxy-6-hydroxymethyldihydropteridine diphosphokinase [Flavobacteriaceae bacterium]|nr:2-amino-4-hydroxy-6-hydroxymethyldihydropteridine diphosphokinase [Flavobacteriaceae bacterium]
MKIIRTTYLSLGSNQGNLIKNLQNALDKIAVSIGKIVAVSSVYKSKSWGFKGADFYNNCIKVATILNLEDLGIKIFAIEKCLGREKKKTTNYENRIIDIDILLFDDQVVFSKNLCVPHPKMLDRSFVLRPLAEIAPYVKHPIENKTITACLQICNDKTALKKINLKLEKPLSLDEKYNYIAIEGNIGAGKTTLANMIGADFNAKLVLERFADNPFLPKFYKDKERFAFPLEMSFLADRYQQLSDDLAQFDLFKNLIVSDYYIFKSLIFSQITLQKEEYHLYRRMFDVMYKKITKPDLYIYLYQNTKRLLDNIKNRGRDYEKDIKSEYLDKIHKGYFNFIKTEQNLNTLIIDVSEIDFVKNKEDYHSIIKKINTFKKLL